MPARLPGKREALIRDLCHPDRGTEGHPLNVILSGGRRPESKDLAFSRNSKLATLQEDTHYRVLRLVEARPQISQRELAEELGVSLGKANYCVKALMDKGWIKVRNFTNSNNKRAYLYLLTPRGVEQKTRLTASFLKRKLNEYDALKEEIQMLRDELNGESHE